MKYEVQGNSPVEIPQSGNDDGCDVGVCVDVGVLGGVAVNVVVVVGVGVFVGV